MLKSNQMNVRVGRQLRGRLLKLGFLVWDISNRGYISGSAKESIPDFIVAGTRGVAFLFLKRKIIAKVRRDTHDRILKMNKFMTPCIRSEYVDDANLDDVVEMIIIHL